MKLLRTTLTSLIMLVFGNIYSQVSDTSIMVGFIYEDTYIYNMPDFEKSSEIESIYKGKLVYLISYLKDKTDSTKYKWFEVVYGSTKGFILAERILIKPSIEKYLKTKGENGRETRLIKSKDFTSQTEEQQKAMASDQLNSILKEVEQKIELGYKKLEEQKIKITSYSFPIGALDWPGFEVSILNGSRKKTLKYIWITIVAYNPVNDVIGQKTVKCIGPIKPHEEGTYEFDNVFATRVFEKGVIKSVKIQYMDNSIISITGSQALK